jgi:N-acyl-D-aspartate/D-glutamate deacylase
MDLVIRGGTVVDGTGAAPAAADIGIDGDRIVEVGRIDERGRREIHAEGMLVTPGFVDIHTHYDGQATWDPLLAPSSLHGVTSIAMGNCGVGFAPARTGDDAHAFLINLLEGVEDIPGTALAEGLTWDWESFPDYLDALERRSFVIDVAAHVPHAAVRAFVMGERGADATAVPTEDEIASMSLAVEEAIAAGALGFTTSRTYVHRTRSGQNIGTYRSGADELLGVADGLRRAGTGVMQLISDAYLLHDDPDFVEADLALIRRVVEATKRPLSFTVQQPDTAADRWQRLFAFVREAQRDGLPIRAQIAPRPIGLLLGLPGSVHPFLACRAWHEVSALSVQEQADALRDPERRARVVAEFVERPWSLPGFDGWPWDRFYPLGDPPDYEPRPESSIAAIAARRGVDALDVVIDLMTAGDGTAMLYCPLHNYASGDLSTVREMLTFEHGVIGLSDGGAHCGVICDASFPTTALQHWGRDRERRGLGDGLPVERIVHALTQRTAAQVGWLDRGVLAPGHLADVNVIDFEALTARAPEIVHDLPAGGRRLMQRADGYIATVKRGAVTFRHGEHTGELPGTLVRGAQPAPT